jgi:hypothetical protein
MDPDAPGSVTRFFDALCAGDPGAAEALWERFFPRLVGLARRALAGRPQRAADADDAALSAFASFCLRARAGEFRPADREGLWHLLAVITARKAHKQAVAPVADPEAGFTGLELVQTLPHKAYVGDVRFSADGSQLLTACPGKDGVDGAGVYAWDAKTWKPLGAVLEYSKVVKVAPVGGKLVVGVSGLSGSYGQVPSEFIVWNPTKRARDLKFSFETCGGQRVLEPLPDGKGYLASVAGGDESRVAVFDLEIGIYHGAIRTAGDPANRVRVRAAAKESHRAIAEAEVRAAGVPTAERLRGGAVDRGRGVIHPPHHVADPDRSTPQTRHAGPDARSLADGLIEDAFADRQRIAGAIGDVGHFRLAVVIQHAAHVEIGREERVRNRPRHAAIV